MAWMVKEYGEELWQASALLLGSGVQEAMSVHVQNARHIMIVLWCR
jgi:hypothetical protein